MEEQNPNPPQVDPPQPESKKAKSAVGKLVAVVVAVVVVAGVAGVLLQSGYFKGLFGDLDPGVLTTTDDYQ